MAKSKQSGYKRKTSMVGAGSNFCTVHSSTTSTVGTANASGKIFGLVSLDPFSIGATTSAVNAIAGAYEFYRIKSASVEIVGTGGSTMVGEIVHGFICNPEIMYASGLSNSNLENAVYNEQGTECRSLFAGGIKRMSLNRVVARRWFSCNYTLASGIADFDRSIEACHAYVTSGTTPSAQVAARLVYRIVYEFAGLGRTSALSIMQASSTRFPYQSPDGSFPLDVTLSTRDGTTQDYVRKVKPPPTTEQDIETAQS